VVHRLDHVSLPSPALGTRRELAVHRFGRPGARPKAYVQAGLHAGEIPGLLVAHHLIGRLRQADTQGAVLGEVVVVPAANPIGLAQNLLGRHIGRFELAGGVNFNRAYPALADRACELLAGRLTADALANRALARAALREALAERRAPSEAGALRLALVSLAVDADIALDLHCDNESELHIYMANALWPGAADLAAELGATVVLLASESGGDPFDESLSAPWGTIAARFGPKTPVPADGCLAATVELRGSADVSHELAQGDAAAVERFLRRRGVLAGAPAPLPHWPGVATALAAVDVITSPVPGVLVHGRRLGARLNGGDPVAEVIDPTAADPAAGRTPLTTRADGRLFARCEDRWVRPGQVVAKVAGAKPLPGRAGNLLEP
jgi:predicted deacylase